MKSAAKIPCLLAGGLSHPCVNPLEIRQSLTDTYMGTLLSEQLLDAVHVITSSSVALKVIFVKNRECREMD